MKSNLAGLIISAVLHIGLVMLVINLDQSQPPKPLKAEPIPLTLAMFKPEPALEVVVPVIEKPKPEPVEEIKLEVVPVIKPKPESKPEAKTKPKPKKKKVVKKKVEPKPKIDPEMERLVNAVINQPKRTRSKPVAKPRSRPPVHRPVRQAQYVPKPVATVQRQARAAPRRTAPQKARPIVNNAQADRAEASYRARLIQLLNANKRYPKRAKRMRKQGTVKVSFTILHNGSIQNIRLASSSGNSSLDSAALRAVKSISGKLPFPKEIGKTQWMFSVPVMYQLR